MFNEKRKVKSIAYTILTKGIGRITTNMTNNFLSSFAVIREIRIWELQQNIFFIFIFLTTDYTNFKEISVSDRFFNPSNP